jgi:transposase
MGTGRTTVLVAGLRLGGLTGLVVMEGAMNGDPLTAWAGTFTSPSPAPGGIVILDNPPAHKVHRARAAIERVGAGLMVLPPWPPDVNPIDQAFARLKALLRKGRRKGHPNPRDRNCHRARGVPARRISKPRHQLGPQTRLMQRNAAAFQSRVVT